MKETKNVENNCKVVSIPMDERSEPNDQLFIVALFSHKWIILLHNSHDRDFTASPNVRNLYYLAIPAAAAAAASVLIRA